MRGTWLSQVIMQGQVIAIPRITSMETLIHERSSNNAEAKYTLMYCCWLSFEMDWISSLHIGTFQFYDTFNDKLSLNFFFTTICKEGLFDRDDLQ